MESAEREELTVAPDGRPAAEQPRWRRDFPIDWPQDEYVARREFSKFLVLTSLAFVAGHLWIIAQNILRRRKPKAAARAIAEASALPVGGWIIFDYPGPHDPALLVRISDQRFVAYDQKCTHLSCPVLPQIQAGRLHCPCHEGVFDLATGRPLAGPPRRPLARINLEIHNGRIYAAGIEERLT